MDLKTLSQKYPLVTMVCAFAAVSAVSGLFAGTSIAVQLMGASASAAVAVLLLYGIAPKGLRDFPVQGAVVLKAVDPRVLSVVSGLMLVAAVGGMASFASFALGGNAPLGEEAVSMWAVDGTPSLDFAIGAARFFAILLLCMMTGLYEEALFRGIVIPCAKNRIVLDGAKPCTASYAARGDEGAAPAQGPGAIPEPECRNNDEPQNPNLVSALFSALLFGLVHISSAAPTGEAAVALDANGFALAVHASLKIAQTALFGFCMAAVFIKVGSIWLPMAAHACFDLLYFAPVLMVAGEMPATYITGSYSDIAVLVLTIVMLLHPSVKSAKLLL